jgi:hypothetical protein
VQFSVFWVVLYMHAGGCTVYSMAACDAMQSRWAVCVRITRAPQTVVTLLCCAICMHQRLHTISSYVTNAQGIRQAAHVPVQSVRVRMVAALFLLPELACLLICAFALDCL